MPNHENVPIYRVNYPIPDRVFNTKIGPEEKHTDIRNHAKIVVLAIIDDGIPFAHKNFRYGENKKSTRVEYCWSQGATSPGDKNEPVRFGREFTRTHIETRISDLAGNEDAIYEQAGLLSSPGSPPMPLDRLYSHGAHVLDTMAGNLDEIENEKTIYKIIAVDLPPTSSWDTSGFGKDMFVLSAMHYIFKRADDIARSLGLKSPLPLIINFSYGLSGGPHDGTASLEAAMDEMVKKRRCSAPTALVVPSGNEFLQSLHAVLIEKHFCKKIATLDWQLQPNDQTSSYLEIWMPKGWTANDFEFLVSSPNGQKTVLKKGQNEASLIGSSSGDESIVGKIYKEQHRLEAKGRWRVVIAIAPTDAKTSAIDNDGNSLPSAQSGTWRISLKKLRNCPIGSVQNRSGKSYVDGVEIWIQRDEVFGQGKTGARQSYLRDPKNELFWKDGTVRQTDSVKDDAKVRRFGSMNGLATGNTSLVVGGYNKSLKSASVYSSAGSLRYEKKDSVVTPSDTTQVDISAVVDRSQWQPGIIAAGTRSGSNIAAQGTSSASPQICRLLAKLFGENNTEYLITNEGKAKEGNKNYMWLLAASEATNSKIVDRRIAHPASKQRLGKIVAVGE